MKAEISFQPEADPSEALWPIQLSHLILYQAGVFQQQKIFFAGWSKRLKSKARGNGRAQAYSFRTSSE
jgi:hypothetical protein